MPQKTQEGMVEAPAESPEGGLAEPTHDAAWPHHAVLLFFTFMWGGNFVLAEVALREMAPIAFSVARFVMGGVAMIALLYVQVRQAGRRRATPVRLFPEVAKKDWPRLLAVSVLGATLAPWLGIEGLGLTHGARASLWLALGPVVSTGLGYLMRTERIGPVGIAGGVMAGLGSFALAVDGLNPERAYWLGDLLLLAALLLAVGELHLIKPLAARYGATPMVAARTAIGGGLYVLIATPALAEVTWLTLGVWTWIAILVGGAIGVGVGQWVKVRALRALGPTRVVLYGNLVPLAALWLAWLTIGTQPSVLEVVAGVLIIIGAICLQVLDPSTAAVEEAGTAPPAS
jgi:drug/metabolite transporter (DMT)-like permease